MKKVIRLTESDLVGVIKRVINEQWVGPGDKVDFQPCLKEMFGDKVINSVYEGKTYQSIKGTGDYEGWFFYKGNTAYNPVQKKMVPFTCAGKRSIILNTAAQVSEKGTQMVNDQDKSWDVITNGQKVIGIGSTGPLVKSLQGALSKLGWGDGPKSIGGNENCTWEDGGASCDGKFGRGTKKALIEFQKHYNISADGIFGRQAHQIMYEKRALKTDVKK